MRSVNKFISTLPPDRQEKIRKRTEEILTAEEKQGVETLHKLKEALEEIVQKIDKEKK